MAAVMAEADWQLDRICNQLRDYGYVCRRLSRQLIETGKHTLNVGDIIPRAGSWTEPEEKASWALRSPVS